MSQSRGCMGLFSEVAKAPAGRALAVLALAWVLAALGTAPACSVSLQPGWPQSTGGMVWSSPALGDLDGDGDLEVVVGSWDGYVYAWHANGALVAGWPQSASAAYSSPVLGDLDGDDDLEVVVGSRDGKVYAWHGDGSAVAGWPQAVFESRIESSPALGDLDGDGDLEVVVGSEEEGSHVYAWHGDGTPVAGWPLVVSGVTAPPTLGDLDGDGDLEVVVGSYDGNLYAWHGDGTAVIGWPQSTGAPIRSNSAALGDLDGDGDPEVLVGNWGAYIYAWHGNGTLVAGWPQHMGHPVGNGSLGDLDGDGDLEVVIPCGDEVYAWHGNGTPVAGWPQHAIGVGCSSPALGDLDGDGDLEVVIGSNEDGGIYAWHGNGSPVAGWPQHAGSGLDWSSPAVGDLDGDGDVEVVIGCVNNQVYAWSCNLPTSDLLPWPMLHHDIRHTGRYTAPAPLIFQDDFEDAGFTQGNWWWCSPKASLLSDGGNGVLRLLGAHDFGNTTGAECIPVAANGMALLVDGTTVAADVRIVSGEFAGVYLGSDGVVPRAGAPGLTYRVYYLGLAPGEDMVGLDEMTADGDETLAETSVPIDYNTWYRVELVSTATNFEVWVAPRGQPLVKVIDVPQDALHPGQQAIRAGAAGVYSHTNTLADFDNVALQGEALPARLVGCPLVRGLREASFTGSVWASDASEVAGFQFDLHFDSALLSLLQVEKGDLIAADPDWTFQYHTIAPGHLRCLAYNTASVPLPAGAHGEMVRLSLALSPLSVPDQMSILQLDGVILAGRLGNAIPSLATGGLVRVARAAEWFEFAPIATPQAVDSFFDVFLEARDEYGDPGTLYTGTVNLTDLTGTLLPTTATFGGGGGSGGISVKVGQAHAADTITATDSLDAAVHGTSNAFQVLAKGDVNGDGTVNVLDVVRTVAIALGTVTPTPGEFAAADANRDGVVNVLDVIIIQNLALGIHGMAPAGQAVMRAAAAGTAGPLLVAGAAPPAGAKRIAVPVVINSAAGVAGFNFDLAYDARVLTPVEVRAGTLLVGKADWVINANLARNPLRVLCYSRQSRALVGKGGTLVEVIFAETGKAGKGALSLGGAAISDAAGKAISRTLSLGKAYTVK